MKHKLVLILENIRSTHNVGSILRSADGFRVSRVYFNGITPYPKSDNDSRLPYLADKIEKRIKKTSLGAEKMVLWEYVENIELLVKTLVNQNYEIIALEQTPLSLPLNNYKPTGPVALVVGNEVDGISPATLELCKTHLGNYYARSKESLNVSVATAIALYQLSTF